MMLADALANHEGALRADFQRFYGLNLDEMGTAYSYRHAADLAAYLPPQAALWGDAEESLEWPLETYLLASIERYLRVAVWQRTEDGRKGVNCPQMLQTPADRARLKRKAEQTDLADIAEKLGLDNV